MKQSPKMHYYLNMAITSSDLKKVKKDNVPIAFLFTNETFPS